jgi:uncharacterized membrane protein YfcA
MLKLPSFKVTLFALLLASCMLLQAHASRCKAKSPKYTCPNCGGFEVTDCLKCDGYFSTDDLHNICINRRLFRPFNVDTEDHDNHYHFLWQDLAGMFVWFFMGGIATACGVGGGGIYVPLGMLLLQFSPRQASGLSQCSIFGATLGGLIINIRDLHPAQKITDAPGEVNETGRIVQRKASNGTKDGADVKYYTRPRISYDMTLYLAPVEMAGAVVGVLIQTFLPNWAFLMVASIVLLLTAYKTYQKFGDARKKERKAEQEAKQELEAATTDTVENAKVEATDSAVPTDDVQKNTKSETEDSNGSCATEDDNEANQALRTQYLEADMRQYPVEKLAALIFLWVGVIILTLLRGGRGVPSLVGITCESHWYIVLFIIHFGWLAVFAAYYATRLLAEQKKRVAVRYPYQPDDTIWDLRALRVFGMYTFFAGIIAGLIGIGGGMVRCVVVLITRLLLGPKYSRVALISRFLVR